MNIPFINLLDKPLPTTPAQVPTWGEALKDKILLVKAVLKLNSGFEEENYRIAMIQTVHEEEQAVFFNSQGELTQKINLNHPSNDYNLGSSWSISIVGQLAF